MSEPFYFSIQDLTDILAVLSDAEFNAQSWHDLGLSLRLLETNLDTIEKECSDSHACLRKCLSLWLKSVGTLPQVLASALDDISYPKAADRIRKLFCNRSSQYLMSVSRQLTCVLFTDEIVSLFYTEKLIDKRIQEEMRKRGNVLFNEAIRAICLELIEEPSKLKILADILLKCKKTESVGKTLLDHWNQNLNETKESIDTNASSGKTKETSDTNTSREQFRLYVTQASEESFDDMRGTFGIFKTNISSLLNKIEEPAERQKEFLERTFPELTDFGLSKATTTKEIVDILLDECNIINIAKIKAFATQFKCDKDLIKEYREELKKFCSNTRVDLLLNKDLSSTSTSSLKCEEIEIVLDWKPSEHSLSDIELLLKKIFKDLTVRVIIKSIKEGSSIIITCYAPRYLMDELLLTAQENLSLLIREDKLTRLRFGHHTVFDKIATEKEKEWKRAENEERTKKIQDKEQEMWSLKTQMFKKTKEKICQSEIHKKIMRLEKRLREEDKIVQLEKKFKQDTQQKQQDEEEFLMLYETFVLDEERRLDLPVIRKINLSEDRKATFQAAIQGDPSLLPALKNAKRELKGISKYSDQKLELTSPTIEECRERFKKIAYYDCDKAILQQMSPDTLYFTLPRILQNPRVKVLCIYDSLLTKDCIRTLSVHLTSNSTLVTLRISNFSIDDEGLKYLCSNGLLKNSFLLELWLCKNRITVESIQAVTSFIAKNSSLMTLSLLGTDICSNSVCFLMDSLKRNKTLNTVYLNKEHQRVCEEYFDYELVCNKLKFL